MLINASGIYEEKETSPRSFKGTQGIARDITQLKDLEDRLRQALKMEAIGTLSGGIAHDFNNILGGIIGYSELALDVLPQDARKLKKYLGRVLSSGRRAGDLVRQILQFAHRGERILAPTDIEPVVKETLELMRATLPKTIAIETEFSSDVGVIMADPTQIHQVLMNLFTNAFHAMRKTGGTLSVSMDAVTLTEEQRFRASSIPPGRYVRFSVADTGPGIPAEIQDRIFEPYFTTKEIGEGTGLGLSVSLGIIETHGGAIDVQSATGSGATFTVWLPAAALSASPDTTITAKLPRGNGQRILFVEDEPFFLDAITEQLESLGYFVKAAHDGRKALDLLQANLSAFDLVITDQTMPTITGIQLAGQIRNLSPDIPVILCTGYSETVTEETAARFGITKFLLKPIDRKELAVAVHHALNQTIEG
jgi:signal transduction histidine kinase/ActR/RegA family two-component response regulator